jgi:hypothetical protein
LDIKYLLQFNFIKLFYHKIGEKSKKKKRTEVRSYNFLKGISKEKPSNKDNYKAN